MEIIIALIVVVSIVFLLMPLIPAFNSAKCIITGILLFASAYGLYEVTSDLYTGKVYNVATTTIIDNSSLVKIKLGSCKERELYKTDDCNATDYFVRYDDLESFTHKNAIK